jgi:ACS family glucarate transporter-like MFS transporter
LSLRSESLNLPQAHTVVPGGRKYAVVSALFLLSMITYIDRVCISAAKDPISAGLSLSDGAMGLVFSAFALGYAIAQIPSGWFADKAGPRIALATVVGAWSALTALTGAAWNVASLVAIRFLFGIGEAGAFPGSARAIVNWLPPGERGRANGVLFSGSRLGAALAFPLLAWMLARWSWRPSFFVLGCAGALWAAGWLLWFRDHPPGAKQARGRAAGAPLRELIRSRGIVLAMAQYFASNFTFFLCLSWMLPYMKKQYQLSDSRAAVYAMIPLLLGATSQWLAGTLVDRLYHSTWRAWSRRLPALLGFVSSAGALLALTRVESAEGAVVCFTVAAFGADMTISPSWVFCADVAGAKAGSVSGAMNMFGNFGSFVSANAFPFLHGLTGSASTYFAAAALMNAAAVFCWLRMKSPDLQEARL